jgi:hypothetical protein
MKKAFILFCSAILLNNLKAQDTIIKNSGDTVLAKITEIASGQIKYKRSNFPDGPSYLELKSDIVMIRYASGLKESFETQEQKMEEYQILLACKNRKIEIKGHHGYRQNGTPLPEALLQSKLLETKDLKIMKYVSSSKKYKGLQYIGFAAIPLGIAGIAACSSRQNELVATGVLSIGAALTCHLSNPSRNIQTKTTRKHERSCQNIQSKFLKLKKSIP